MWLTIDPLIAAGVVLATTATDAVYVMFTSAVVARKRMNAATWSSVWFPRRRGDRIRTSLCCTDVRFCICPLLALRVISRRRNNSVAFGAERTLTAS